MRLFSVQAKAPGAKTGNIFLFFFHLHVASLVTYPNNEKADFLKS